MPTVVHDRIRFHFEVIGHGSPVVFCHGLGGNLSQPLKLLGRLPHHRLIVWDCRGHGRTKPLGPASAFNFEVFARDLRALLDHLRVQKALIGGISMGAGVAVRFAVQWPERVRSLVLVRPAWLDHPSPANLRLFPRIADYLGRLGRQAGLRAIQKDREFQDIKRVSPETAHSLCGQFKQSQAVKRRVRLERMPQSAPIRRWQELQKVQAPALVMGNENDPVHPIEFAAEWARHLPQAELVWIPSKSDGVLKHQRALRRYLMDFIQ
jgi:pimeloyl-ACP methyl ester carboxylesterase